MGKLWKTHSVYDQGYQIRIEGDIRENPCGIRSKAQDNIISKVVSSIDEYRKLANTPYQNQNIICAFFVSLNAGCRCFDVKTLRYGDIDYGNKIIRVQQEKVNQVIIGYPKHGYFNERDKSLD